MMRGYAEKGKQELGGWVLRVFVPSNEKKLIGHRRETPIVTVASYCRQDPVHQFYYPAEDLFLVLTLGVHKLVLVTRLQHHHSPFDSMGGSTEGWEEGCIPKKKKIKR